MKFNNWFTRKHPETAANQTAAKAAIQIAEAKLAEAEKSLQQANTLANELKTQHEANHFRERLILALTGGE